MDKSLHPPTPAAFEESKAAKHAVEPVALGAGGIFALLAGACCVVPLLLVTAGLGGAWLANLQWLEPYRPLFISIAVAALALSGWRIYRPAAECSPGEVCAVPVVRRGFRIGFWFVAALLVTMLGFPYLAPFLI